MKTKIPFAVSLKSTIIIPKHHLPNYKLTINGSFPDKGSKVMHLAVSWTGLSELFPMLGYLHHALNFLQLNVVTGKSHQTNGVVEKSNLVAENINLKRSKLPHQASITRRLEEPHHSRQEEE